MDKPQYERYCESPLDHSGRRLHWYEWLACLLLMGWAAGAYPAEVYRCTNAQGDAAFQDRPCAAMQNQRIVDVARAPAYSASPDYAQDRDVDAGTARRRRGRSPSPHDNGLKAASSWECRATDGQVFYRHTPCPHSIAAQDTAGKSRSGKGAGSAKTVSVSSYRVTREEACTQMRRAGAIGRSGHGQDQDISTYEKNLGRDPCR